MSGPFAELSKPGLRIPERPKSADDIACPKCRFTGTGEPQHDGWRKMLYLSDVSIQTYNFCDMKGRPLRESLMISCVRCGFNWREDVSGPDVEEVAS